MCAGRVKGQIVIEKLNFYYKCGFDDAAHTAIIYGTVSGAAYGLYAFLKNYFKVKDSTISIYPDFNSNNHDIRFNGLFTLRILYIVYILLKLAKIT